MRSRLEALRMIDSPKQSNKSMEKGNEMHWILDKGPNWIYKGPKRDWYQNVLRYKLWTQFGKVFEREFDGNLIVGIPDSYRILSIFDFKHVKQSKVVSIIEHKTTSRPWIQERMAIFQLQLYIYVMEPYMKELGYELHKRHYVEIYNQQTGRLMKRICVEPYLYIEDKIKWILDQWRGLQPLSYAKNCHQCPKRVKLLCPKFRREHGYAN